ncbi:MAG: ABC transporter ATP-binding protein [Acidobacteriota bacterium]
MRGKPISIAKVVKRFGKSVALKGVSLEIAAGEFVALLGPSGCGKTTLLRILAGLEDPDEGRLTIGDRVCYDAERFIYVPPGKRDIGLIFQSYALWPHLTVKENILFAPRARGDRDAESAFPRILSDLKLTGLGERYPSQLSGGQQQRVAIGRMLAARPSVFLMDEPLSNLDAALRFEMRHELRRIHETQEATTVYVTHDQGEALAMADRVAVMDAGDIVQVGPPTDVYRRPATLGLARFLANPVVNVLDAEMRGPEVRIGSFQIPIPPGQPNDGRVVVTARPEDIHLNGSSPTARDLKVKDVMPLGAEAIATLSEEGCELLARVSWERRPGVGETVRAEISAGSINIYSADSGRRIGP